MFEDRQFELILFDLEGTLVNFQWHLKDAAIKLLQVLSNAGIDPARYGESPGYAGLYNTTRDITDDWDIQETEQLFGQLAMIYDFYDLDALSRWTPYPDVRPVLEKLSVCKYRMGVVSNCGYYAAETVLERFDLAGYFELVVSRNDVLYLKPFPDGLNLAIEKLCMPADKTLFVGDSINDILAANKVPVTSCFLSGGESRVTGEDSLTADFRISSFSGLADILVH
ncbi:HAD family hydrolase [Desulfobacula phenolica]|uniref:phosphoglycolate phosphatase n=1 Tax=Desulfobacula phenolica TaxID=90732 RepID=A0A1H2GSP5_9BACT|nr:HAD family hydrolase [Desulfobacula phenolica]SDU22667.1 phosphoglycolate phosphatase [Desulfobacula phenolica]